jgi:hypothetical protein
MSNETDLDWLARNVHVCLEYRGETGEFTWKIRPVDHFKSVPAWRSWNTKFAGRSAGHFNNHEKNKYVVIRINGVSYGAHRIAMLMVTGEIPEEVDHVNGIQWDNRICNLKASSRSDNAKNLPKRTGRDFIGISIQKGKYRARINVDGKEIALGTYSSLELAMSAREKATEKYGFGVNHGR